MGREMIPAQLGWKRLNNCDEKYFYAGVTFMFKTNDSGPFGIYQYAIAVLCDGNRQFMFVSSEGRTWAYGPNVLPVESNYDGMPYTLSAGWLKDNLNSIANIEDPNDVWYAKSIKPVPVSLGEVH